MGLNLKYESDSEVTTQIKKIFFYICGSLNVIYFKKYKKLSPKLDHINNIYKTELQNFTNLYTTHNHNSRRISNRAKS